MTWAQADFNTAKIAVWFLETGRFLPVSVRVPWFLFFWFWMRFFEVQAQVTETFHDEKYSNCRLPIAARDHLSHGHRLFKFKTLSISSDQC